MPQNIVAIVVADLHLCHKPPVARSAEPDWYAAMGRQLDQLWSLTESLLCPVIIAGDIFDRWNAPAELINFCHRRLPVGCYAVPGQHDLAHHSYRDIPKTAYWTLVEGEVIRTLPPGLPIEIPGHGLRLHGFPWGYPPKPLLNPHDLFLEVAVVHHYVWTEGRCHPGASPDDNVYELAKKLKGYEVAVLGDNHVPFQFRHIYNCGGFFRRRSDEVNHKPSVGLLLRDGKITRHYLDVSEDVFADPATIIEQVANATGADLRGFIAELGALGDAALDWPAALRRYMKKHKVRVDVRRAVLKALEE